MKKIIIITMALLLGLFIGISSAVEVKLLGPNKYQRTTGKPDIFTDTFSATLGTGKLTILNGKANGKNRVSSALILLNGKQVIGPNSFSQNVYNIEISVKLSENNSISIELRSSPESYLIIQVTEEITESTRTVGPAGGTLKFHNEVILNVPANAVAAETAITVKDLKCSDVDPILQSSLNVFHPKRCLGAFSAEPAGLVFQLPVIATVPVLPLEPGEIPIQLTVDLDSQTYNRVATDLIYYGDRGAAEMKIRHFSGEAAVAEKHEPQTPVDTCEELGLTDEDCYTEMSQCTSCAYFKDNEDLCTKLYPYTIYGEPGCCGVSDKPPGARDQCFGQGVCDCCTEKRIHVVANELDFIPGGQCQILSSIVTVTYLDCPGTPTPPSVPANEASPGCESYNFTISIVPSTDTLPLCEKKQLKATIIGTSDDGKNTITFETFNPDWESLHPDIVSVDPLGWATRLKEGDVEVKAYVNGRPDIDPGYAIIGTSAGNPEIASITITPPSKTLWTGEYVSLLALAKNANGSQIDVNCIGNFEWYSSNLNVATLVAQGPQATITAVSPGEANITAVWGDTIGAAKITVTRSYTGHFVASGGFTYSFEGEPDCFQRRTYDVEVTVDKEFSIINLSGMLYVEDYLKCYFMPPSMPVTISIPLEVSGSYVFTPIAGRLYYETCVGIIFEGWFSESESFGTLEFTAGKSGCPMHGSISASTNLIRE
jgi:hypothetical protein